MIKGIEIQMRLAVMAAVMLSSPASTALADTLTVCPDGCDFAGIQEAVQSASPGDRVEVEAGEYEEAVVIDRCLSLIAVNGSATLILPGQGSAVTITSPQVTVQNFSAQGCGDMARDAAIKVLSSQFLIQGCQIQGNYVGIYVMGGADGTIQENQVLESGGSGIVLEEASMVRVIRNTIMGCGAAGIELEAATSCAVEANNLSENLRAGVMLHESAESALINNSVDGSRIGLGLVGGTNNLAGGNQVAECELGISLENETAGNLEGNRLYDNEYGINLDRCDNGTASGNYMDRSEEYGIYLNDCHQIAVEGNMVNRSGDDGIGLLNSTDCTLTSNDIVWSRYDGIRFYNAPHHIVRNNVLRGNGGYGINIDPGSQGVLLEGNQFENNSRGEVLLESAEPK